MKVLMKFKNLNRGGEQEYTCPSLLLIEVNAESGFATSEGISASCYVDGEEF